LETTGRRSIAKKGRWLLNMPHVFRAYECKTWIIKIFSIKKVEKLACGKWLN
jgi:hypothetical protein